MTDYAKKKNDELAALCKERGLAHTGKKADLVKRLEDHDAQGPKDAPAEKDQPATTTNQSTTTTQASEAETKAAATATAPTNGAGTESKVDADTAATSKAAENFEGLGLQEASLDEEIAKRKRRAEKFGMDPSQDETLRLLERAKRFGTTNVPGLLNQALPEKAERHKKRGREGREENSERKKSRQRGNEENDSKPSKKDGEFPSWMTAADREKAEKRKAKFGPSS